MLDHCISFFNRITKENMFKSYIADALKIISENTGKFFGGGYINIRYADLIDSKPKETKTADEIINNIKDKLINLDSKEV